MVIYEVNLQIEPEIYTAYMAWLKPHIAEMLQFPGFMEAKITQAELNEEGKQAVTIWYSLDSKANLDNYLTHHASAMRQDGIAKFGQKFAANRRIFEIDEILSV